MSMSAVTSRRPSISGVSTMLRGCELRVARGEAPGVELEDEIEARHLLLDQAPLVHAARAFEQQRLRIDRHEHVVIVRDACPLRS